MTDPADIQLTLPVPPSANRLWRNGQGRTFKSAEYMGWLANGGLACAEQTHGDHLPGAYAIAITLPKTRIDPDNAIKPVQDLLQRAGIVANDRYMRRLSLDVDEARTDVLVRLWALPSPPKTRKRK